MSEEVDKMQKQLSKEEIYAALNERHSPEIQAVLSAGNVAIAGLGGLGSNVAYSLTRIGVGHLHLIDFDVVDVTNLNRQQYFMEHVGMYKTEALKSLLMKINPYIEIKTDCVRVTEENIKELFCDNDIVCEAFDNPERNNGIFSGEKACFRIGNGRLRQQQQHCNKTHHKELLFMRRQSYRTDIRKRTYGSESCGMCGT